MSLSDTIKFITEHPLNRAHKIRSIVRFAKWQVGSRLRQGPIVYDWVNGSKFLVTTGETGLTGNIYAGLHEFPDMGFLLHSLCGEDTFVDVGANVGSYTILACSAVGAKGIAFEPIPDTYNRLIENMRLNNLDKQVDCLNKGVGAAEGSIAFTRDNDTANHALAAGEFCANEISVDMVTLDSCLVGEYPSLIKIDVEGYELPVLEGAQETLSKQSLQSVIVELNESGSRYQYDESRILGLMFDFGFNSYSYNPMDRTLKRLKGKNQNSGNTLFIRNKSRVEEKLRIAPTVSIHGVRF